MAPRFLGFVRGLPAIPFFSSNSCNSKTSNEFKRRFIGRLKRRLDNKWWVSSFHSADCILFLNLFRSIAVAAEEIHPAADNDEDSEMSDLSQNSNVENDYDGKTKETHSEIDVDALRKVWLGEFYPINCWNFQTAKVDEKIQESTNSTCRAASNDSNVLISPPYYDTSIKPEATLQHDQYSSGK